jgi:hypothetical protein
MYLSMLIEHVVIFTNSSPRWKIDIYMYVLIIHNNNVHAIYWKNYLSMVKGLNLAAERPSFE